MSDDQNVWPAGMPEVGQRAELTREVSAQDIEMFTAISGDRNPLHYDAELAGKTKFGGIIVQGGITSAILNAVVAEKLPGPGTVFLHVDWNFKAPVRPGDPITGRVEVKQGPHGQADDRTQDHSNTRRRHCRSRWRGDVLHDAIAETPPIASRLCVAASSCLRIARGVR